MESQRRADRERSGTYVVDLVGNAVRQRKSFRPAGRDAFIEGLSRINVPRELIGNQELWKRWYPRIGTPDTPEHRTPMAMSTMVDHARRRERYEEPPLMERPDAPEHQTPMSMPTRMNRARQRERNGKSARWLQYNGI